MNIFNTGLIFTPEVIILFYVRKYESQEGWRLKARRLRVEGCERCEFDISWNFVKERKLHNFTKNLSGTLVNQIKNQDLNGEFAGFRGAMKSYRKIIFVSATKIGENTTNILNCYFSS